MKEKPDNKYFVLSIQFSFSNIAFHILVTFLFAFPTNVSSSAANAQCFASSSHKFVQNERSKRDRQQQRKSGGVIEEELGTPCEGHLMRKTTSGHQNQKIGELSSIMHKAPRQISNFFSLIKCFSARAANVDAKQQPSASSSCSDFEHLSSKQFTFTLKLAAIYIWRSFYDCRRRHIKSGTASANQIAKKSTKLGRVREFQGVGGEMRKELPKQTERVAPGNRTAAHNFTIIIFIPTLHDPLSSHNTSSSPPPVTAHTRAQAPRVQRRHRRRFALLAHHQQQQTAHNIARGAKKLWRGAGPAAAQPKHNST
ncbi:hypothetical protein niasHT_017193 [Heterodera trifolii]|uniref:Uncharacterized protein n=1 Tax=Heterodera trifolii TaxID=157864 RepID=A0ABD2LD34_9BILA